MQRMVANKAQCHNEHAWMLQQFAMMMTNQPEPQQFSGQLSGQPACRPQAGTLQNYIPSTISMQAPAQQWALPGGGGRGSNRSRNGRGRCLQRGPAQPIAPVPFVRGDKMIPYIPAGIKPDQH